MKIICEKSELVKGMNIALRAITGKTTMPITECVLIQAENGEISLTGNDFEVAAHTYIGGTVKKPGAVAVNAKLFNEIIRKLPNQSITVNADSHDAIKISSGKANFTIPGLDPDLFTDIPEIMSGTPMIISQIDLKQAIQQTLFSTSQSDNNKVMMGELFEVRDNGDFRIVALDGHRIAMRYVDAKCDNPMKIIVPAKGLSELVKILEDSISEVKVSYDINHIVFDTGDYVFSISLIAGDYFKIDSMQMQNPSVKVTVSKAEINACLNRSVIVSRESEKRPVIFKIENDTMRILAQSAMGTADEEIEIQKQGDDLQIGFNPRFLLEVFSYMPACDTVTMEMTDAKHPCYIRDEDAGYTYIVLPVNI